MCINCIKNSSVLLKYKTTASALLRHVLGSIGTKTTVVFTSTTVHSHFLDLFRTFPGGLLESLANKSTTNKKLSYR